MLANIPLVVLQSPWTDRNAANFILERLQILSICGLRRSIYGKPFDIFLWKFDMCLAAREHLRAKALYRCAAISIAPGEYRIPQGYIECRRHISSPEGTYRPLCPVDMPPVGGSLYPRFDMPLVRLDMHPCGCERKLQKGTTYHVHKQNRSLPMPLLWGGSGLRS